MEHHSLNFFMKKDRSDWTVRKVTFAEAEELDDVYYGSLSEGQRLEIVMDLRSIVANERIAAVVFKRHIHEQD